jgi:tetratricopeptide (TPR) repeat protein
VAALAEADSRAVVRVEAGKLTIMQLYRILITLFFISFNSFSQEPSFEKDVEYYTDLIAKEPTANHYYLRGYSKFNLKDYEGAMEDYDVAIQLEPDNFDALFSRGILFEKLKDFENAINDFTKCISLNGSSSKAFFNRAYNKSLNQDFNGAVEDYSKSISLSPQNQNAYFNRGMINKFFSKVETALKDFDEAIKIDPNFVDAYQNRAILKSQLKNKDAINDFNKVIELNPKDAEGYYNRAIYYINNNIKVDYCSDLSKAFQLGFEAAYEPLNDLCKKKK